MRQKFGGEYGRSSIMLFFFNPLSILSKVNRCGSCFCECNFCII